MNYLQSEHFRRLDDDQKAAVTADGGLVRVVAGAGTGKTTTLIARIAWLLLEEKVPPSSLLVVAFTNKAASEIRMRLHELLAGRGLSEAAVAQIRLGTFHSHCARFLRRSARVTGLAQNFTICDEEDSRKLVRTIMEERQIAEKYLGFEPDPKKEVDAERKKFFKENSRAVQDLFEDIFRMIQRWKENGVSADSLDRGMPLPVRATSLERDAIGILHDYDATLASRDMLDFCDLIGKTCRVLEDSPSLLQSAAGSVRHLLVDEFQDVNRLQKRLVDLLSSVHGNVFVVGDGDQSIYAFRGSTPQIMERMGASARHDITLRRNRRCTRQILQAANPLVEANRPGQRKELFSDRNGSAVESFFGTNEFAETAIIVRKVSRLLDRGVPPGEIAILARTSNLLKPVEAAFLSRGIPYNLVSGTSLLESEEYKDFISYLRVIQNPYDDLAFTRIINKPVRGIGPAATTYITSIAERESLSPVEICEGIVNGDGTGTLNRRARENIGMLLALFREGRDLAELRDWKGLFDLVVKDSGYLEWLEKRDKEKVFNRRKNNLYRIRSVLMRSRFDTLLEWVDSLTLSTDTDSEEARDKVMLSTIHAAKGMEFDHVFCPAMENGILPHARSMESVDENDIDLTDPWDISISGGLEEERRLAHVAFTRARQNLYVSCAKMRANRRVTPSSFLKLAFPGRDFGEGMKHARPLPHRSGSSAEPRMA